MSVSLVQIGIALGWAAFALHLIAFAIYNWKMFRGASTPNIATWSVWVFVATLNCITYFFMSDDWVKSLQPLAGSLACLTTFGLALFRGKLTRPNRTDVVIFIVSVCAVLMWWQLRNATYANLMLQLGFVLSFVPTLRDIIKRPQGEAALPWLLWGLVYVLLIATVILRWNGHWPDLAYPMISMVCHTVAGLLALRK